MAFLIRQNKKCLQHFQVALKVCRYYNGKAMPITEEHIRSKLQKELEAAYVEVIDHSDGCGEKFSCLVVSDKFKGKPLLQRHRLVNNILQEELKNIHAFSQQTLTPEQWAERQ